MLDAIQWVEAGRKLQVSPRVRVTDDLPNALWRRMEQMELIQRGLVGYCHAVSILLQLPGGADYCYERRDRKDFYGYIWRRGPRWPIAVLRQALAILEADRLLPPVFRTGDSIRLPARVSGKLSGLSRNPLLNVVAECLDRLLITPFWEDEARYRGVDASPEPSWWNRLNTQLEAANRPKPKKRTGGRKRSRKT